MAEITELFLEERLLYSNVLTVFCKGRKTKERCGEELWLGSWTSVRKRLLLQQAQSLVRVKTD